MTESHSPGRKLTDTELAAVLARALELHALADGESETEFDETGLRQLEEASAEIGVSPDLVRRAAREILPSRNPGMSELIEIRTDCLVVDRVFQGNFSPDDAPHLLYDLCRIAGTSGEWQANRDEFSWSASGMCVRVTSVGQNSRVDVRTPFGRNGFPLVGCATVWGTLFALVAILLSGGNPFSGISLLLLALTAAAVATTVHLLTRNAFARARRTRLEEATQALVAVTSRLRA